MDILLAFFLVLGIALFISLSVVIYNNFTAPKLYNKVHDLYKAPFVSILVPARNEESNIEECIRSVLHQNYNNFEMIILDDDSKDRTEDIIKPFEERNSKIKLIKGKKLPSGWLGKNWACSQLAEQAKGEVLLFIDADVRLEENALNSALYKMQRTNTEALSVFPTQIMNSVGEYFIVPLMNWLLLSFLPLKQVYKSKKISFVAANGQFMMFKRDVYFSLGGHESIKNKVVEDMEFARMLKQRGFSIITALGYDTVYCRMYSGFDEAFNGFVKNFFPGFNTSPISFLIYLSGIQALYLLPIVLSFFSPIFIWLVFAIILNRLIISFLSKQSPLIGIIHPLQMLLLLLIGVSSINAFVSGKLEWKGRRLNQQPT